MTNCKFRGFFFFLHKSPFKIQEAVKLGFVLIHIKLLLRCSIDLREIQKKFQFHLRYSDMSRRPSGTQGIKVLIAFMYTYMFICFFCINHRYFKKGSDVFLCKCIWLSMCLHSDYLYYLSAFFDNSLRCNGDPKTFIYLTFTYFGMGVIVDWEICPWYMSL